MKRAKLRRTCDGRERFSITAEIRKLITKNTRNRKQKEAVKAAFAKHTNWANISNELRISRPMAPPIFRVEGISITSDQEAMTAMASYIEKVYAEPKGPVQIPLGTIAMGCKWVISRKQSDWRWQRSRPARQRMRLVFQMHA